MSYYSGKDGFVSYNGTLVAKVSSWSFSSTVDTLEVTNLSLSDRTFVPGLRTSSGSATIFYYDDAAKPLIERVTKIDDVGEDDILTIRLGWGAKYIQGSCIITSAELNCAVGEVMQATVQFQFTGVLHEVSL